MPTYDYLCKTCGHRFEYFQSISSDALTTCPVEECAAENPEQKGKGEVRRLVSGGAGLVFKGEGFYLTDYVRKGGKEGKGGSSSPATTSSSSESASEKSASSEKSGSTGSDKGAVGGPSTGTGSSGDS